MAVVKCKVFANKLKKKWMETKALKAQQAKDAAQLESIKMTSQFDSLAAGGNTGSRRRALNESMLNISQG